MCVCVKHWQCRNCFSPLVSSFKMELKNHLPHFRIRFWSGFSTVNSMQTLKIRCSIFGVRYSTFDFKFELQLGAIFLLKQSVRSQCCLETTAKTHERGREYTHQGEQQHLLFERKENLEFSFIVYCIEKDRWSINWWGWSDGIAFEHEVVWKLLWQPRSRPLRVKLRIQEAEGMLFFALKSRMGAAAAASTIKRPNNPNDTGLFIQLEQLLHAIPRPGKGAAAGSPRGRPLLRVRWLNDRSSELELIDSQASGSLPRLSLGSSAAAAAAAIWYPRSRRWK